jgi:hypothetical protein
VPIVERLHPHEKRQRGDEDEEVEPTKNIEKTK